MKRVLFLAACTALFVFAIVVVSDAQEGKLKLHVTPKQSYIFVDGRALSEASLHQLIRLPAGDHNVEVANYGYEPEKRQVTISADKTVDLEVNLKPDSRTVAGPFGAMTIENANHDAVLLNGKDPAFFVGHGDEFNHDWWSHQELIVPPGEYEVTILKEDKTVWSGPVTVAPNQRVVIDAHTGVRKTVPWERGAKFTTLSRFQASPALTRIAIAKPSGALSASSEKINCGESSQLKWNSTDAPHVEIAPLGTVANSGEQAVQPKQNTTYQLVARGPGGTATSSATVDVNAAVQANIGVSTPEARYRSVGDKVLEQNSVTLTWSAENASTLSIDPIGAVEASGSRSLQISPNKTESGPVDETVTYKLTAKNECGGTAIQTATLHVVGSIEPMPELKVRSIYFPTDLPTVRSAGSGLLEGEKAVLRSVAETFKKYMEVEPNARLTLAGHADRRGPSVYNQPLSERRVQVVKAYLIEEGIPDNVLDTEAYGSEQNMAASDVKQLLQNNPELTEADRTKALSHFETVVLANNRRVDITLSTTGQQSAHSYPYNSEDVGMLMYRNKAKVVPERELTAAQ